MTDYIKRADAIEAVSDSYDFIDAIKAIEALPSADAEDAAHDIPEYCRWSQTYTNMVQSAMADTKSADAVQGEWNKFDTGIYLCSNCNWAVGNEYNYCPCCGTKMVKGGDDE